MRLDWSVAKQTLAHSRAYCYANAVALVSKSAEVGRETLKRQGQKMKELAAKEEMVVVSVLALALLFACVSNSFASFAFFIGAYGSTFPTMSSITKKGFAHLQQTGVWRYANETVIAMKQAYLDEIKACVGIVVLGAMFCLTSNLFYTAITYSIIHLMMLHELMRLRVKYVKILMQRFENVEEEVQLLLALQGWIILLFSSFSSSVLTSAIVFTLGFLYLFQKSMRVYEKNVTRRSADATKESEQEQKSPPTRTTDGKKNGNLDERVKRKRVFGLRKVM